MVLSAPVPALAAAAVGLADPPLADLFAEYRALGLPVPHPRSRLMKVYSGGGAIIDGVKDPLTFSVTIADPPDPRANDLTRWHVYPPPVELRPDPGAVGDLGPVGDATTFAVECYALGWDRLARHYYRRSVTGRYGRTARECLGAEALQYWTGRITDPAADRSPIPRRLAALLTYDHPQTVEYTKLLIPDLELALRPGRGKPGTVEALVDRLVDSTGPSGTFVGTTHDEHYWRVVRRGFDAVPALIAALDDDRLTRCRMDGFNNFWPWHMRVKHVASQALDGLAGGYIGEERNWMSVLKAGTVTKAEAGAWWAKVKGRNEEAYFVDRVLKPSDPNDHTPANEHALAVVVAKYPKRLPGLYAKALATKSEWESGWVARAVVRADLPRDEKLKALLAGAAHNDADHATKALDVLRDFDSPRADALFIQRLNALPGPGPREESRSAAGSLAYTAAQSNDPAVWTAMLAATRRVPPDARAAMLYYGNNFDLLANRPQRLRLLLAFFDDTAEFDVGTVFRKDHPEWRAYTRLEIRNAAGLVMARLLPIEVNTDVSRTAAEWAALRVRVRTAAEAELKK